MNSSVIIALVGLLTLTSICLCDEGSAEQSRATQVTSKAMDSVKNVVQKGAQKVEKAADGITVNVERFVNPEPHKSGESNLLVSAGRGVGRLIRNVTVEVGRAVNSVIGSTYNLAKHTSGAARDTVGQALNRIANPRKPKASEANVESGKSTATTTKEEKPKLGSKAEGQSPPELIKREE